MSQYIHVVYNTLVFRNSYGKRILTGSSSSLGFAEVMLPLRLPTSISLESVPFCFEINGGLASPAACTYDPSLPEGMATRPRIWLKKCLFHNHGTHLDSAFVVVPRWPDAGDFLIRNMPARIPVSEQSVNTHTYERTYVRLPDVTFVCDWWFIPIRMLQVTLTACRISETGFVLFESGRTRAFRCLPKRSNTPSEKLNWCRVRALRGRTNAQKPWTYIGL